ncbi:MAG: SAF domain-containing protein [Burkholderiaceae bacterium]
MSHIRSIGLVGTGFIAAGFARLVQSRKDYRIAAVLSRRHPASLAEFPCDGAITGSIDELIERSDLVVECSGDPLHATTVIDRVLAAGRPVVTMNSEFHVTTGAWFVGRGLLTEAEGDQPGCLAALHEEAVAMGFEPLVYGNMKGFLDHHPKPESMRHWADRQGFSLNQTTSFTDGTKLQIEQTFIANGMGATISRQGLEGPRTDDTDGAARELATLAETLGRPIADYIVSGGQPPGVFIAARHQESERGALRNIKMGDGPHYVLTRNYHLCALEIIKTVNRVFAGGGILLDNSAAPELGVVAIAKRPIAAGQRIEQPIGGFELRGESARLDEADDAVPIGILEGAILRHAVEPGQVLQWSDVDIPDSLAHDIARRLHRRRASAILAA